MAESIIYSGNAISVADSKGRFALPLEMRKLVRQSSGANSLYLSVDFDMRFAIGYGLSHRDYLDAKIEEKERIALGRGDDFDIDHERELLFADLKEVNFDDGGRFFLPDDIRAMLSIEDALVFIGVGRHMQIWEPRAVLESKGRTPRLRFAVETFLAERAAGGAA